MEIWAGGCNHRVLMIDVAESICVVEVLECGVTPEFVVGLAVYNDISIPGELIVYDLGCNMSVRIVKVGSPNHKIGCFLFFQELFKSIRVLSYYSAIDHFKE